MANNHTAGAAARTFAPSELCQRMLAKTSKGTCGPCILYLEDGTIFYGRACGAEGIQLLDAPCFSVQYHPEASPGPTDAHYLFTAFTRLMDGEENYLDIDTAKDRLAGWNFAETAATETEEN